MRDISNNLMIYIKKKRNVMTNISNVFVEYTKLVSLVYSTKTLERENI